MTEEFDKRLEAELDRGFAALSVRPIPAPRYRSAQFAAQGNPVAGAWAAISGRKALASLLAAATLTLGGTLAAAAATGTPPLELAIQISSAVVTCKQNLDAGRHGIGDCVSEFVQTQRPAGGRNQRGPADTDDVPGSTPRNVPPNRRLDVPERAPGLAPPNRPAVGEGGPPGLVRPNRPEVGEDGPPGLVRPNRPDVGEDGPSGLVRPNRPDIGEDGPPGLVRPNRPDVAEDGPPGLVRPNRPDIVEDGPPGLVRPNRPDIVEDGPPGLVRPNRPDVAEDGPLDRELGGGRGPQVAPNR